MSSTLVCILHPLDVWGMGIWIPDYVLLPTMTLPITLITERSTGSRFLRAGYLPHANLPPHIPVLGFELPQPILQHAFPMNRKHQRPQASDSDLAKEWLPPPFPQMLTMEKK